MTLLNQYTSNQTRRKNGTTDGMLSVNETPVIRQATLGCHRVECNSEQSRNIGYPRVEVKNMLAMDSRIQTIC